MTSSTSDFAQSIRRLRHRAGLSQEELAERAGVSARAISDMERGLRKHVRPETLRMLLEALGVDDDERARLMAAVHPELRDDIPAPFSRPSTAIPLTIRPLPIPPDALIGRESDIIALGALVREEGARLVTLTGPGGVGKTRLALAAAERHQGQWDEGAAFVDLAPLTRAEHVPQAIALALGIALDSRIAPQDAVAEALRDRSLLLLLDNLEHLVETSAWIATLLAHAPRLTILVTSRIRLRVRGEFVFPVAPLTVPAPLDTSDTPTAADLLHSPAVRLFRDRARQAGNNFTLNDTNASAVAALCRELDGLPLAIELAASRVGLIAPASLLDRIQTLHQGHRDGPERQQTLQHAIAWSYDLLDPNAQHVFQQLAVFAGGFTLDAAEAVAGEPTLDMLDTIATLVESNLLTSISESEPPRFAMLETIHRDAAMRLEQSGQAGPTRRRHADWMIALVEAAGSDLNSCRNSVQWYARLTTELSNLRHAVAFLSESGDGDAMLSLFAAAAISFVDNLAPAEGVNWIESGLSLAQHIPDRASIIGLSCLVVYAAFEDDRERGEAAIPRLQAWTRHSDDPLAVGTAYFAQGVFHQINEHYADAVAMHEQSLAWFLRAGLPAWTVISTLELGNALLLARSTEAAVTILEDGAALASQVGSAPEMAYGSLYLGYAELERNRLPAAAGQFSAGLAHAQNHRIARVVLGCIGGIAAVAHASGNPSLAARLLGATEAARQSNGGQLLPNQPVIEQTARLVADELGPERDLLERQAGASLTFNQVIALAQEIAKEVLVSIDETAAPASRPG